MGNKAILNRINKIMELQAEIKELEAVIDGLKDEIKADMTAKGVDEIETGDRIVRWKEVTSLNLDSTKLKKALPDVYKLYAYERTTKRFTIA